MILTTFEDKSFLEFASGSFDDWCVFVVTPINRYAPKDTEYFERLVFYANKYSAESLYKFFVDVYDYTTKDINPMMFDAIKRRCLRDYKEDALELSIIFSILYASMIAEENKAFTKLRKEDKASWSASNTP